MQLQNHSLGQKVLVTGASGFIGNHLCKCLSAKEAEVHGISRTPHTTKSNFVHWWQGDLEDISNVRTIVRTIKPDIIYHLASNVTGSRAIDCVLPTLHSNLVSTVNLLTASTEIGCRRIVLAGSLEEPDTDQGSITPSSPYAATKWASSAYSRMFYELYQAPVVTAKIFMVYGPEQNLRFLIPYVISSLLEGSSPKLSSGTRPIDWIYIDDLVAGLIAMSHAPGIEGCTIDLGTGTLTTIREVVEQLVNHISHQIYPSFGAIPDRPKEQIRVANTTSSYTKLRWKATTPLEEGLKLTVEWYRKHLKVV